MIQYIAYSYILIGIVTSVLAFLFCIGLPFKTYRRLPFWTALKHFWNSEDRLFMFSVVIGIGILWLPTLVALCYLNRKPHAR